MSADAPVVEEGRLVERVCTDCGNVERRAFGEFISARGELASYAFGWTSGHEDVVGHFTVGLGVGNAGGGTFHAQVRDQGEGPGFMLIDTPFEDVPEGGPDLTRDEALAHECIEFVWWVVDEVVERDRRASWMLHWLAGTRAFVTPPVAEGSAPVLRVTRDEEGDWQLFCETVPVDGEHCVALHLFHLLDRDHTLLDVLDLAPGEEAERDAPHGTWTRRAA